MKIILNERQYRRIFLSEVASKEDMTTLSDLENEMKSYISPAPTDTRKTKVKNYHTVGETISKWDKSNPFYGYHELPTLKDLPFIKLRQIEDVGGDVGFTLKHPIILVTDYDYEDRRNSVLKVYKFNLDTLKYEHKSTLFGATTISDLSSSPLCGKNKRMGDMINACVNWKKYLVKVGTYDNTAGKKRKDGCEGIKNKTPNWLHGCGDHPYKSDAYLHPEAAQSFNKMNRDYKNMIRKKGISINSAYRDVFHQGGVNSNGNPKAGSGTSNHGFGLSLDVGRGRNWMKKNGGHYGWCWFGAGDKPHFNYFPVLDKMGKNYTCVSKGKKRQQFKEGPPKK
jgi:hypothetical protein